MDEALHDDERQRELRDLLRQLTRAQRAEFARRVAADLAPERLGGLDLERVTHRVGLRGYLTGH